MMRLPSFKYRAPKTLGDAVLWLAESPADTMLVAGGTDLLPNMKRRQQMPKTVIGLRGIAELSGIRENGHLSIGAATTLTSLVNHAGIRARAAGLWQSVAQIATPHLRNMGTIGGNLCLDTRCTYYDQTEDWRKAIGYCMKKDGSTCWVATSSKRCLAVSSTDTAPILWALGARVTLASALTTREILVADLYNNDGMRYLTRRADELLTRVEIPDQTGWLSTYWKLRRRGSFDFPVGAAAVSLKMDRGGRVEAARVVLGAVASQPMPSPKAEALLVGQALTDDVVAAAAEAAFDVAKPMDNTDFELVWRKKMVRSLVTNALRELRGDDMRDVRFKLAKQIL